MYTLLEAQNLVEKHIQNLSVPDTPPELYEPVRYILSLGGKRIRPALVILACDMFAGEVASALIPAVAIEVFHNFTLLHDDIMDRSERRRGKPTVHIKYNESTAILSGDVMSILASRLMNQAPGVVLNVVQDVFTQTAMQVCEGQQIDMNFEELIAVSEEEYLTMIELKTAVLIAASLKIGAILGGASQRDGEDLYKYGRNLGIAFQIVDDILDFIGTEEELGKPVGSDLAQGTLTLPAMILLERYPEDNPVKKLFQNPGKQENVELAMDMVRNSSIPDECYKVASDYSAKACHNLKLLPHDIACQSLADLADYIISRRV